MTRVRSLREAVSGVLQELGVVSPEQLCLESIARHLGAEVKYADLDGCAANLVGVGNQAIITVDSGSDEERRRFSIGHELGHWIFDKGRGVYLCSHADLSGSWRDKTLPKLIERRANQFAAELLMPAAWFQSAARGLPASFDSVETLSGVFSSSRTATAIRMIELGTTLATVIQYDNRGNRMWYTAADDVPTRLYPVRRMKHSSAIYRELFQELRPRSSIHEIDGDEWIDHPKARDFVIHAQGIRLGAGSLILVWFNDERSMLEAFNA